MDTRSKVLTFCLCVLVIVLSVIGTMLAYELKECRNATLSSNTLSDQHR